MEFTDDLAGGTVLVRPALQSPNFVPGVSGWHVGIDGSAEFNNVVIRGGTTVSGLALYYDGPPAAGNLIMSIAADPGVDQYGNVYESGTTVYDPSGSAISINSGGGASTIDFRPPTVSGVTWRDGGMGQALSGRLGTNTPQLFLASPYNQAGTQVSTISLYGNPQTSNGDVRAEIIHTSLRHTFSGDVWMLDQVTLYDNNTYGSWTPALSGGGAATLSTADGWWQRIGGMIFVYAYMVIGTAGTGATQVTMNLPLIPWRGSANRRQTIPGTVSGSTPDGPISVVTFAGGAGATAQRIQMSDGTDAIGTDLVAGSIWIVEGWMREA